MVFNVSGDMLSGVLSEWKHASFTSQNSTWDVSHPRWEMFQAAFLCQSTEHPAYGIVSTGNIMVLPVCHAEHMLTLIHTVRQRSVWRRPHHLCHGVWSAW